jgi:hypothetical protein
MFISSPLATPRKQFTTNHLDAWEDGYYESYVLNQDLPAIRLHPRHRSGGSWFAVDTYDITTRNYQDQLAMLGKRGSPRVFKRPVVEWCVLPKETTVNVGVAAEQGFHKGGGFQFERKDGPEVQVLEKTIGPSRVRL